MEVTKVKLAALSVLLLLGLGCCRQLPEHTVAPQRPVAIAWR